MHRFFIPAVSQAGDWAACLTTRDGRQPSPARRRRTPRYGPDAASKVILDLVTREVPVFVLDKPDIYLLSDWESFPVWVHALSRRDSPSIRNSISTQHLAM